MERGLRRRILAASACFVMVGAVVAAPAAHADPPAGGMTADAVAAAFTAYGDTGGRWAGGDGTVSVLLPDGRIAWFFSDTFVGAVNADHSLPAATGMVSNSILVQDGAQPVSTITGGTAAAPTAVVPTGVTDEGYWIGDAAVEGSTLRVLYNRWRIGTSGPLDYTHLGSALASFTLPSLTLASVTALPYPAGVTWGSSLITAGGYTYIYGVEAASGTAKFAHVARVPAGGLNGAWTFWNGSTWTSDPATSARLLSGVGDNFGVHYLNGQYVLVTMESAIAFDPQVVAYTAAAPTGPFTGPIDLFTAPDPGAAGGKPVFVYNAQLHPELARAGKLLVSYDVNSLDLNDVRADVRIYRARFAEVDWPRPQPDPATLPAAPTGLTVGTDSSGLAHLQWSAPAGLSFRVYQRDVTAGQTHFARALTASQNSADVGLLSTGHTYEFRVSAVNANGEGSPSTVVSLAVVIAIPPAPTGVAATADTAGHATVSWSAVTGAWNYSVLRRDVTAGETDFSVLVDAVTSTTFTTPDNVLLHQHAYEFKVTARHGGGTSPASAPATATASYAVPSAPTGLTATANLADGTIALSWTAPAPNLWYWVYQRDVSAGVTDFTRLPIPISTGTSMTAGLLTHNHTYEYRVTGLSPGGEGPFSTVATATATYPPPTAPSNLVGAPTDGGVVLTWTASPTGEPWYNVFMRDVTAGEPTFTRLQYPVTICCTFTGGLLTNGHMYEFKVTADTAGGTSDPTNTVSVTPQVALPGAVTGLTATPTAGGDGGVVLSWTPPAGILWFNVYQRDVTAGEAAFTRLPLPVTTCCTATIGQGYTVNHHVYEYRIAATNSAGEGPLSTVASVTATYNPPPAPTNLRGRSTGDGAITLDWDGGTTYFWVYYRDATAGQATFSKSIYPTANLTATWGGLINAHVYEFKVSADSQGGEGPASAPIQVTSIGGLPQPPTNLTGSAGDGTVHLQWTASPTQSVQYLIHQRDVTAKQSFQQLPYPAACCVFDGGMLTNGHTYEYKITAVNSSGQSSFTTVVSVRPMPPVPAPPTGLTATPGNGKLTLNWTASTTQNVYYWVEIKSNGGSWQRLQYPVTTCCQLDVLYLTNFTSYQVRLFSTNLAGDSATAAGPVTATPVPPVPARPTLQTVTPGDGQVSLQWSASSTTNVLYWIEIKPFGGSWQRLLYPAHCCGLVVHLLANGTFYSFRVFATNGYDSVASNELTARPMPPTPVAPTLIQATPTGPGQIALTWSASPTPNVYYLVDYRLAGDFNWTRMAYPTTRLYTTFLQWSYRGELYEFRVSASNMSGEAASYVTTGMLLDTPDGPIIHSGNNHNGANGVAWAIAMANGNNCEARGFQQVCYNIPWNVNTRPWTFGDYLLYPNGPANLTTRLKCEAYKRANIRHDTHSHATVDNYGPDLFRHEENHSWQWAAVGQPSWVVFAGLYMEDQLTWEIAAGAYWGGYSTYGSSTYYAFPGCGS